MRHDGKERWSRARGRVGRRVHRAVAALLAATVLSTTAVWAAGVRFWTDEGDTFRQGVHAGTVLSADGWLTLAGARSTLLESSPTRFVWHLATDSQGTLYVATGNQGKLLRLRRDPSPASGRVLRADGPDPAAGEGPASAGEKVEEFYDFTDPVIFSIACDAQDNVYAGTSPSGTVYKLVPRPEGPPEVSVFFDAEDPYIWDMAVGRRGQLYLATGPQGRIYKVEPDGTGSVLHRSGDPHVLSLALGPDDTLYAGTNEHGLVYRISPDDSVRVAYDAAEGEIHAMVTDAAGNLYFGTADLGREAKPPEQARAAQALVVELMRGEGTGAQPSLLAPPAVTFPGEELAATNALYRLSPAGEVVLVGRFKGLILLSLTRAGEVLYLGTGNQGRLFFVDANDRLSEVEPRGKPETPPPFARQITALTAWAAGASGPVGPPGPAHASEPGDAAKAATGAPAHEVGTRAESLRPRIYVGTANPGGLVALEPGFGPQGAFTSQVYDARSVARWGQLTLEGDLPASTGIQVRTRSGQTEKPDETWSDWTGAVEIKPGAQGGDGVPVISPPARFLQYELRLSTPVPGATPTVTQVRIAYVASNQPPRIQGIAVGSPPRPSAPSAAPPQPQPQPQGAPAERPGTPIGQPPEAGPSPAPSAPPQPPQPRVTPGVIPIFWSAGDPDGDQLTFSLYFRGEGETLWKLVAKELAGSSYTWQTEAVPDVTYDAKVVASDSNSNPGDRALSAERVTTPFVVDNTPPRISDLRCEPTGASEGGHPVYRLRATVRDETSPIASFSYNVDAKEWVPTEPADGIFDEREEEVSVTIRKSLDGARDGERVEPLEPGEHTVTLKAADARGNTAAGKQVVIVPKEGQPQAGRAGEQ